MQSKLEFDLKFVSGLATPTEPTLYTANDTELRFKPYSPYPCIVRDIAVFVPEGSPENAVLNLVTKESGELLLKTRLFDVFTKTFPDGTKKTSYAYRLIFQSFERTLTDEEVNAIMEKVTNLLNAEEGWQVR
jgi:phenylalanyl-tRNA synthetase beta subunit